MQNPEESYLPCQDCWRSNFPRNSPDVEFPSLFPFRVYDDLLMTSFPLTQVCQSLRLCPRGKRKQQVNWWKKTHKRTILLKVQVPRLVQLPGTAEPVHSHSKPDGVFNFWSQQTGYGFQLSGWRHAARVCYSNAISTSAVASQHQSHSTVGSPSERTCQLLRLFYPSFYDWQSS